LDDGHAFRARRVRLEPGDTLLGFTDGLADARNTEGAAFTDRRIRAIVEEPFASADALVRRIRSALSEHTAGSDRYDDITVLALRRMPAST
jgi:sigma-B regulation protein RsbU (phosphoserine phosphatase)